MSSKKPPIPRKQPKQSRSQLLVSSIQEACLQILRTEGPDKLTTQRIADVAGVNIASLYQYFPNKEAVLANVYEESLEQLAEQGKRRLLKLQALSEHSLEETLAQIIDWEIEQTLFLHTLNPEFFREYQSSFDAHQRINEMTQSLDNPSWEVWTVEFLGKHRSRLRSDDLALLGFVLRHTLQGNLQGGIRENPEYFAEASFKQELLNLLLGFLLKD